MSYVFLRRSFRADMYLSPVHLTMFAQRALVPCHTPCWVATKQLCARQSVLAQQAVPESLGDIFAHLENIPLEGARHLLSQLPPDFEPKAVNPWET